tara:strand:- start:771 stop:1610 length:840 start_codon:yes stop_codon:yes gene_type:complete
MNMTKRLSDAMRIEEYPHRVEIQLAGHTIAQSNNALLLIETYAPDIYLPFSDIRMDWMIATDYSTLCPHKGRASYWNIEIDNQSSVENAMWAYEDPVDGCLDLEGYAAFYFDKIDTQVDGNLVRGHVRNPYKVITVHAVRQRLCMKIGQEVVVDSRDAVVLSETGLPDRFYVPESDIKFRYLEASDRESVCTYKGEARYFHLRTEEQLMENVVWVYPEPWTDFTTEVARIKNCFGLYTTTFDTVLLDDVPVQIDSTEVAVDRAMLASPTIDRVLSEKIT